MKFKSIRTYTELSYIEGTGTQFIDTGFKPNQDTRIVLDIDISTQSSYPMALLGGRNGDTSSNASFVIFIMTASQLRTDYGSATVNADISTVGRFLIDKNKAICTINDTAYTNTAATFQSDYTLALLTENDPSGYDTRITSAKIYSCQVYDNDVLIRNYVPAKDDNDVVCLYDKVNHEFVYNAGTGTFVAGETIKEIGSELWEDAQYYLTKTDDNIWSTPKSVYTKVSENLTVLDYIESDGASYIDTGFMPNQDTRMVIDYEVLDTNTAEAHISSARTSGSTPLWTLYSNASLKLGTRYGTSAAQTLTSPTGAGRYLFDKNKNTLSIDGTQVYEVAYETFTVSSTLIIFARNDGTVINNYGKGRLYSYKLYDNNVLIRDYVPVLDSSGVACLYDKVTNELFYNQGTGTFSYGYKTEFEPETELAFIESSGTQYIDTGFMHNQNTRVVMDTQVTTQPSDHAWLFEGRIDNNSAAKGVFLLNGKAWNADYVGNSGRVSMTNYSIGITDRLKVDYNKNTITVNSVNNFTHTWTVTTFQSTCNLVLLAANTGGTVSGFISARIYSCCIYDNDTLVRDYIPKTDSQGVPALFDKVSGTYYYNAGTGMFGAVEKSNIIQREYWKQVA